MRQCIAVGSAPGKPLGKAGCFSLALLAAAMVWGSPALADTPKALTLDTSLTVDGMTSIGADADHSGIAARLQATLTIDGTAFGAEGLSGMVDMAAYSGPGLTEKLGDLQGVSNIGAPRMVKPINAWLQYGKGPFALKAGIMDTNADFDEQNIGAIFLNGSHGMAADFGTSGLGGGGAAPFSALGVVGFWSDAKSGIKFRAGLFGGQPSDPNVPERWSWKLGGGTGSMTIAEVDWSRPGRRIAIGGWHHSATLPRIDGNGDAQGSSGGFVTIEATLAGMPEGEGEEAPKGKRLDGWLRLGIADKAAAPVSSYFGGGLVLHGLLAAHPEDALGFAIAHARTNRSGDPTLRPETSFEVTFQHQLLPGVTLQPDAQYLTHPGSVLDIPDALALGLRLIITH